MRRPPGLAVVLVGHDPASEIYVRNKVKASAGLGIHSETLTPPDSITTEDDRGLFTTMHMVLEVANRQHLARVMRALRRLPDVKKITRAKE